MAIRSASARDHLDGLDLTRSSNTIGDVIPGATVKLLGVDAFNLMLGQSPGNITGGIEGLVLGGGVGPHPARPTTASATKSAARGVPRRPMSSRYCRLIVPPACVPPPVAFLLHDQEAQGSISRSSPLDRLTLE